MTFCNAHWFHHVQYSKPSLSTINHPSRITWSTTLDQQSLPAQFSRSLSKKCFMAIFSLMRFPHEKLFSGKLTSDQWLLGSETVKGPQGSVALRGKNESILSSFGEGENEKTWVVAMVAAWELTPLNLKFPLLEIQTFGGAAVYLCYCHKTSKLRLNIKMTEWRHKETLICHPSEK